MRIYKFLTLNEWNFQLSCTNEYYKKFKLHETNIQPYIHYEIHNIVDKFYDLVQQTLNITFYMGEFRYFKSNYFRYLHFFQIILLIVINFSSFHFPAPLLTVLTLTKFAYQSMLNFFTIHAFYYHFLLLF